MINKAIEFATAAHEGQLRKVVKGSKEQIPYITHPLAVSKIVSSFLPNHHHLSEMICISVLHDTIEDTQTTFDELLEEFNYNIAKGVLDLSQFSTLEDGNRKHRKELDARYLSRAHPDIQSIKCADIIHNLRSIDIYDCNHRQTLLNEYIHLSNVLKYANARILESLKTNIQRATNEHKRIS